LVGRIGVLELRRNQLLEDLRQLVGAVEIGVARPQVEYRNESGTLRYRRLGDYLGQGFESFLPARLAHRPCRERHVVLALAHIVGFPDGLAKQIGRILLVASVLRVKDGGALYAVIGIDDALKLWHGDVPRPEIEKDF